MYLLITSCNWGVILCKKWTIEGKSNNLLHTFLGEGNKTSLHIKVTFRQATYFLFIKKKILPSILLMRKQSRWLGPKSFLKMNLGPDHVIVQVNCNWKWILGKYLGYFTSTYFILQFSFSGNSLLHDPGLWVNFQCKIAHREIS